MKKYTFFILALLFFVRILVPGPLFASTHIIQTGNYFFNPATLNINVGDTIKWIWVAGNHTTTSSSVPSGAASWDALINLTHTSYSYQVTVAGTYNYVCTPHIGMGMVASFVAEEPAPSLAVTPPTQELGAEAGTTTFNVESNSNWSASSSAVWCTVTPSGSGNGVITATCEANPENLQRTANILVSVSGFTQTVTIIQDAAAVGIRESAEGSLAIYPNPVKTTVNIYSEEFQDHPVNVMLYGINGQTMLEKSFSGDTHCLISLENYPSGLYFIRIKTDNNTYTRRIIKAD